MPLELSLQASSFDYMHLFMFVVDDELPSSYMSRRPTDKAIDVAGGGDQVSFAHPDLV